MLEIVNQLDGFSTDTVTLRFLWQWQQTCQSKSPYQPYTKIHHTIIQLGSLVFLYNSLIQA
ncbi:unnamed protein product [Arabidopsis halleri]